jgi:hypothetical protein
VAEVFFCLFWGAEITFYIWSGEAVGEYWHRWLQDVVCGWRGPPTRCLDMLRSDLVIALKIPEHLLDKTLDMVDCLVYDRS